MKDSLYIKSRLNSLQCQLVPQAIEYTQPHHERIAIVSWIYNNGTPQEEKLVQLKLTTTKEELIALEFMGENGLQTKCVKARLEEIENILN